ncbi:MAG: PEP-CTERM sorting domain-containing protein [Verrucomicrobiota bacterium]
MKNSSLVSAAAVAARRCLCRRTGISTAALIALCVVDVRAATLTWSNASETPQAWSDGANWAGGGGAEPAEGDVVNVQRWNGTTSVAAHVFLDTQSNAVGTTSVNYGSTLLITSTGEFRNALNGRFEIGLNAASTVTIQSGGKITLAEGAGANMRIRVANGSALNTAGVINHQYVQVDTGSTVNMTGGSITTREGSNGIRIQSSSTFDQSGGDLVTSGIQLNSGNYVVSGGTITTTGSNGLYVAGTSTEVGSSFTVRGSAASLNFGSYRNDSTGVGVVRPTFAFVLDNSAGHISTINLATNGSTGGTLRNTADLDVSLAGGVLLSGVSSYTVIQRGENATDTAWNNAASLTGLWVDATDNTTSTTKRDIKIGLNATADRGDLDVQSGTPLVLGEAFNYGYIDLIGVNFGESLQLGLDISGGTLGDFTAALTEAGIGWTAGAGDYELFLMLNPSVSGGSYFAWDLSMIDSEMGVQGIGLVSIPEPSTFAAFAGLGVLSAVLVRRRRVRA